MHSNSLHTLTKTNTQMSTYTNTPAQKCPVYRGVPTKGGPDYRGLTVSYKYIITYMTVYLKEMIFVYNQVDTYNIHANGHTHTQTSLTITRYHTNARQQFTNPTTPNPIHYILDVESTSVKSVLFALLFFMQNIQHISSTQHITTTEHTLILINHNVCTKMFLGFNILGSVHRIK